MMQPAGGAPQPAQTATWSIYGFGILSLVLAVIIVLISSVAGTGSLVKQPIPTMTGGSQFAIFYLMAQFVERVVEPFSNLPMFGRSQKDGQAVGNQQAAAQQARTVALWCFASALGIVLCYYTIGLFQAVGITFVGSGGHGTDAALSGVIVGAGTKPLHDLIGFIQSKNP